MKNFSAAIAAITASLPDGKDRDEAISVLEAAQSEPEGPFYRVFVLDTPQHWNFDDAVAERIGIVRAIKGSALVRVASLSNTERGPYQGRTTITIEYYLRP